MTYIKHAILAAAIALAPTPALPSDDIWIDLWKHKCMQSDARHNDFCVRYLVGFAEGFAAGRNCKLANTDYDKFLAETNRSINSDPGKHQSFLWNVEFAFFASKYCVHLDR